MSIEKIDAEARAGSLQAIPTPDEIGDVLWKLIATEITHAFEPGEDLDPFWLAEAIDPQGENQAYCLGNTPAEARVKAWITVWSEQLNFSVAPLVVPEGWTFKVYPPGGPMF
jgi:hypothetical protein